MELSGADTARPTFTAPQVGADTTLTFELTVNGTAKDTVDVRVLTAAPPVVAKAGLDQTVTQDTIVTLDASGTQSATKLAWKQTGGPSVTLNTGDAVHPTFRMPKTATPVTFELTASGAGGSQTPGSSSCRGRTCSTRRWSSTAAPRASGGSPAPPMSSARV